MKGLGNYVCLRRFARAHAASSTWAWRARPTSWRGWRPSSRSRPAATGPSWTALAEDAPVWREVTAAPELRLGKRCAYYERCFVTRMRQRALEAQVVLVNHHLFFADLALRAHWPEAQVLPPYEVVIFDEAHQIEEVATEFFGLHVSSQRLFALARDLGRTGAARRRWPARVASLGRRLQAAADAFAAAAARSAAGARAGLDEVRVPMPEDLWAAARRPRHAGGPLPRAGHRAGGGRGAVRSAVRDRAAGAGHRRRRCPRPRRARPPLFGGLARRAAALRGELGAHGRRQPARSTSAG